MSCIWQRLCSGKFWFLRDSRRHGLLAALSCELAWSRSDSPQPENAYGKSEHLGLGAVPDSRWGEKMMLYRLIVIISNYEVFVENIVRPWPGHQGLLLHSFDSDNLILIHVGVL